MQSGFFLSFKNRSNYFSNLIEKNQTLNSNNEINAFEGDFAFNFYTILTMLAGQITTTGMGINELNQNTIIDFIIFGIFIFIIPILFINIFTGISIDEIRKLIDNSKNEIIIAKIDYVYKLETHKIFNSKTVKTLLDRFYQRYDKFIASTKKNEIYKKYLKVKEQRKEKVWRKN